LFSGRSSNHKGKPLIASCVSGDLSRREFLAVSRGCNRDPSSSPKRGLHGVSSWPRLGCRLSCTRTTKTTAVDPSKLKTLRPHYHVGLNEPDEGNKKVKLRKSTHIAGNGPHGDCQAQTVFDYRKDCLSAMGEIPKQGWNRRYTCRVQPSIRPQKLRKRADEELCDPV
jgi:hypothetical protein